MIYFADRGQAPTKGITPLTGGVIELRRSGKLQVSITMSKCINGRLKPFRYSLMVYTVFMGKTFNSMTLH